MAVDTSSDKYNVVNSNSLDISFSNVTRMDGGLYRCVYDGLGTTPELCVYVYGEFNNALAIAVIVYKS